jgi:hypothetical protein
MRSLLSEFTRDLDQNRTVVVMDEDGLAPPRQYVLAPTALLLRITGILLGVALFTFAVVALTPIRNLIPGYSTKQMRADAEQNTARLAQLEDSLGLQIDYMNHLRGLVTGAIIDTTLPPMASLPEPVDRSGATRSQPNVAQSNEANALKGPGDAAVLPEARGLRTRTVSYTESGSGLRTSGLSLPALPPVEGFVTRAFNRNDDHFAVDIAASEGTSVRSIGDGYVVVADWTQLGGYAIAIQHAGGFLSRTGNTGEVTTGPHLHFELWRDGIAQDPRQYILGW